MEVLNICLELPSGSEKRILALKFYEFFKLEHIILIWLTKGLLPTESRIR